MGVTIFYKGNLSPEYDREEVLDVLQDTAKSLEWKYEKFSDEEQGLLGIFIIPHPHCENLNFVFTKNGQLINLFMYGYNLENRVEPIIDTIVELCFCKTQFSTPATHITIIKLLDFLKKKYFKNLEIIDDGGYYPDGDTEELVHRMDLINEGIGILEKALKDSDLSKSTGKMDDEEDLLNKIEKILRDALIKWRKKKGDD